MLDDVLKLVKDEDIISYQLLVISMLYAVSRVVYQALYLKKVAISLPFITNALVVVSYSDFILPAIFILSNLIIIISGKRRGILIILFGIVCEWIFIFAISHIASLSIPAFMSHTETLTTNTVNLMGNYMYLQYTRNILINITASAIEIIIFVVLFRALKRLIFATLISVFSSILLLNIINHGLNRQDLLQFISNNCILTAAILMIYLLILFGIDQTIKIHEMNR